MNPIKDKGVGSGIVARLQGWVGRLGWRAGLEGWVVGSNKAVWAICGPQSKAGLHGYLMCWAALRQMNTIKAP